jgi:hypothetical protein
MSGNAGGIKAKDWEQDKDDALATGAGPAPTTYVKSYDDGRPKH